jgi:hypothetical protein
VGINLAVVQAEAEYLKSHTLIASFLDKKISPNLLAKWILPINKKVGLNLVSIKVDMGRGFMFLSTANPMVTKKVLALTPHATPWRTCIYQEWTPSFDPNYPVGLKIPTSVLLGSNINFSLPYGM